MRCLRPLSTVFLIVLINTVFCFFTSSGKLLIALPSREQPEKLFHVLDSYYQKLSPIAESQFLVICDLSDSTMNNIQNIQKLQLYRNIKIVFLEEWSIVTAYNCIEKYIDAYDAALIATVRQVPNSDNFDETINTIVKTEFPDLDGIVSFQDAMPQRGYHEYRADLTRGHISVVSNAVSVIGKNYFKRFFNYVYSCEYNELYFAQEELAIVAKILRKEKIHPTLFKQIEESNTLQNPVEYETFKRRRLALFDIKQEYLDEAMPKMWSILICTIEGRENSFDYIANKLQQQINNAGLQDKIEVLFFKDKRGEHTTGFKRAALLTQSKGKYICCVDDDDEVHDNYIEMLYNALQEDKDCVSLMGIRTHNGHSPSIFVHSARYDDYFTRDGIDYRPPNHLNPLKRAIGVQFMFPNITISEDSAWAMAIATAKVVQTESYIDTPYYFYKYIDK